MISPNRITKDVLAGHGKEGFQSVFISGSNMHPNPKLYKYSWWIFDETSPYDNAGEVFYKDEHSLNTHDAIKRMEELRANKIRFAYVNIKLQRLGCNIWDYDELRMSDPDIEFAPSYDDDQDPAYNSHK